jgi:septal ring factor EnvC (AmiA/AmiB activator)
MMAMISTKETEVADAIVATDKQLAEVNAKLGVLCLTREDQDETEADWTSAISQVAVEQAALGESRKLLEELFSEAQTATANSRKHRARAVIEFGNQNKGLQIGVSYGAISGITFGKKKRD